LVQGRDNPHSISLYNHRLKTQRNPELNTQFGSKSLSHQGVRNITVARALRRNHLSIRVTRNNSHTHPLLISIQGSISVQFEKTLRRLRPMSWRGNRTRRREKIHGIKSLPELLQSLLSTFD
jgi:hypothetical protein